MRSLREHHLQAVPVPGPSSVVAALSVAGLPTDRFLFEGFLPAKASARHTRLASLRDAPYTLVFFEAGRRIKQSVADMKTVFGAEREAVIAREMTKAFEEVYGDSLVGLGTWLAADAKRSKGEFVIMVHGAKPILDADALDTQRLLSVLLEELPVKRAAAIAAELTGLKKNALYALALRMSKV